MNLHERVDYLILKMPPPYPERFQVSFSFAGEQRDFVRKIAECLRSKLGEGSVFLDEWYEAIIAGYGGVSELQEIYSNRTEMVVVCVSREYGSKPWTQTEYDAIQGRMLKLRASGRQWDRLCVLPIRVGEGDIPGMPASTICPDVRNRKPEDVAKLISDRLEQLRSYQPPAVSPLATALLTPAVARLAAVSVQVEDWLEGQQITVLRVDPTLPDEAQRSRKVDEAIEAANVIVDWVQTPDGDADRPFSDLASEIRKKSKAVGKKVLSWQDPSVKASESSSQEAGTRSVPLESFKSEVLNELKRGGPLAAIAPVVTVPGAASLSAPKPSRLVIAAAAEDRTALNQIVALVANRPRDARVDELHHAPDFSQTPDWDEEVKDALRRKGVTAALFIHGNCKGAWIDRRIRAYDIYREELPQDIKLLVWDLPSTAPREPRYFLTDYEEILDSVSAQVVISNLPV